MCAWHAAQALNFGEGIAPDTDYCYAGVGEAFTGAFYLVSAWDDLTHLDPTPEMIAAQSCYNNWDSVKDAHS